MDDSTWSRTRSRTITAPLPIAVVPVQVSVPKTELMMANNWVFSKRFHWILWIHWQKILYFKNIIQTCHLLCERPRCYHSANTTQVARRTLKFSLIHALVIYQIPWICWIHWISDQFRENSIIMGNIFCRDQSINCTSVLSVGFKMPAIFVFSIFLDLPLVGILYNPILTGSLNNVL